MAEFLPIIRSLTPKQLEVLSSVATGNDAGHHAQILRALQRRGLVMRYMQQLPEPGAYPVVIERWKLPLAVHLAWATYCSEERAEGRAQPLWESANG